MVTKVFKNAWQKLLEKPTKLWGYTLLVSLLQILNSALNCVVFVLFYPIFCILRLGGINIMLRGFDGKEVEPKQIFEGGKDHIRRIAGMGWCDLWCLIWAFVPVMNIIKSYSYKLTPYILLENDSINATNALKTSMHRTQGYKGQLFLADILKFLIVLLAFVVCGILVQIPLLGALVTLCIAIGFILFFPLFCGFVDIGMYKEITAAAEMRDRMTGSFGYNFTGKPSHFCPNCGRPVPEGYRCACTDAQQAPTVEVTAEPTEEPSASADDNKPQE